MRLIETSLLVVCLLAVPSAWAASETFFVRMDGGQEVPGAGDPDGTASGTISIDDATGAVAWSFNYADIAAPTGMHIHVGAAGVPGGVLVTLGVATSGGAGTLIDSTVHATLSDLTAILANPAGYYVNIHTGDFPAGAVRGQLGPLDDQPALTVWAAALLGLLLVGASLWLVRRAVG